MIHKNFNLTLTFVIQITNPMVVIVVLCVIVHVFKLTKLEITYLY